ncbi:30S ribosomal protein S21 [candidate division CPR3 bacterium 4484_211]|uniref:Small ribosomal subunit protein bS21 n=1 Tax=candidate division CPR3 bacterium 4484_211 TaxID=1968527 RepID=A0A1W9NZV5_UNCC3|nr:MAG: 30S ribosomal protein S21 [candidate division CPR3 bacterium 4484_211]
MVKNGQTNSTDKDKVGGKADQTGRNRGQFSAVVSPDEGRISDSIMPNVSVTAKPGESAESLLRRFKMEVEKIGLMEKLEEIRWYEKPSQRKKYEEKMRQQKIAREQKFNR